MARTFDLVVASVLPQTEHPALLCAFSRGPFDPPDTRINGFDVWAAEIPTWKGNRLVAALVCLTDKGVVDALGRTKDLVRALPAETYYLVGTAAGRRHAVNLVDVVVCTDQVHYYERNYQLDDPVGRASSLPADAAIARDVKQFYSEHARAVGWKKELDRVLQELRTGGFQAPTVSSAPEVEFKALASGEKILDEKILDQLAQVNDLIAAGDQEAWGFAKACTDAMKHWLVVRGISDFGDKEQRKEMAVTASASAASYLRTYLVHAYRELPRTEIPEGSFLIKKSITQLTLSFIRQSGLELRPSRYLGGVSLDDLVRRYSIVYRDQLKERIRALFLDARARAFDEKYAGRATQDDERYLSIDRWNSEFRALLVSLGIRDLASRRAVCVGIGNGLEGRTIYDGIGDFIGVDIATHALTRATECFPRMRGMLLPAEDLRDVGDGSRDLYISLRTYQSRFLDVKDAIYEAYRVLAPGGWFIASISNAYAIDKQLAFGLLPSQTRVLDLDLPWRYVERIRRILSTLDFDRVSLVTGDVEIYVTGQRTA